jgi:UDP-N-acetylglucosamine--N-acetylmuramyl-(pentapeptide) pyrophosphoryl-undecaprenol N-acetylglucosamine transferase
MALVNRDAALFVKDADAPQTLLELAVKTVIDDERLIQLSTNIKTLGVTDSADRIADEVIKIIGCEK